MDPRCLIAGAWSLLLRCQRRGQDAVTARARLPVAVVLPNAIAAWRTAEVVARVRHGRRPVLAAAMAATRTERPAGDGRGRDRAVLAASVLAGAK
jgi:hypothetical protein